MSDEEADMAHFRKILFEPMVFPEAMKMTEELKLVAEDIRKGDTIVGGNGNEMVVLGTTSNSLIIDFGGVGVESGFETGDYTVRRAKQ